MWTATTVVFLSVLCVPLTQCSDLTYTKLGEEITKSNVEVVFERFTRDMVEEAEEDDHVYYTSEYYGSDGPTASSLWQDLASMVGNCVVVDSDLSDLHRFFEVHNLEFQFPFYGHIIQRVAVTTGGFLYTGELLHPRLTYSQFIAPLLADFNPNVTDTGRVLVWSTDERFTVQWDKVHNHDHLNDGPFTFQVSIFPSGEIHFVYQEIPLLVNEIDNDGHPVEVGLADAYYINRTIPGGVQVVIHPYHRVSLNASTNLNNSAYILTPVLNCVTASSCNECANISAYSTFNCQWCNKLERCSDGFDRKRQEWFRADCDTEGNTSCKDPSSSSSTLSTSGRVGIAIAVIVVVVLSLLLLLGVAAFCYAYKRPTSKMGQFMIKHRPKARSLNKNTKSSHEVSAEKAVLDED